jgi:hypothetical protein
LLRHQTSEDDDLHVTLWPKPKPYCHAKLSPSHLPQQCQAVQPQHQQCRGHQQQRAPQAAPHSPHLGLPLLLLLLPLLLLLLLVSLVLVVLYHRAE